MAHRGDVFPYVPIATELVRRGHEVRFVTPRQFHPLLTGEPFTCVHSGTDFSPIELDAHGDFYGDGGCGSAVLASCASTSVDVRNSPRTSYPSGQSGWMGT
jgi:hypothetical protein